MLRVGETETGNTLNYTPRFMAIVTDNNKQEPHRG